MGQVVILSRPVSGKAWGCLHKIDTHPPPDQGVAGRGAPSGWSPAFGGKFCTNSGDCGGFILQPVAMLQLFWREHGVIKRNN